ncbi:MAG TPA: ECF-type sigma factor, partial [Humisphaera sp.]
MPPTADAVPAGDATPPAPAGPPADGAAPHLAPTAAASPDGPGGIPAAGHSAGDLLPLVYEQLRRLARQRMADERSRHTLQPTALVHEAYLRLEEAGVKFAGKGHFLRVAAKAMQRILIEHA